MNTKFCRKCGTVKTRAEFSVQRRNKDGMQSSCKACNAARYAANAEAELAKRAIYYAANSDKIKAREAQRYIKKAEYIKSRVKQYSLANKEKIRAYQSRYAVIYNQKNAGKVRARRKAWCDANPHKLNAQWMKRHAAKLRATPAWVDHAKIEEFYFAADFLGMVTGEWHEVDHVVPLQAKTVCGLHVHNNLQVLTRFDNRSKGHYQWPDMP